MLPRRYALIALVVTLGLALSGCLGLSTKKRSSTPPRGADAHGSLAWKACDGGFQCATLAVPLDYTHPDGTKLTLALVRKPATGKRIGSLLVNPGGPGGSGVDFAEGKRFPAAIAEHFDVVGFDPRGVGRSSPLNCHSHLQAMYDADPTLQDAATKAAYLKVSEEYVHECAVKEKEVLPYLGTLNVARDLDRIREALGEAKLNYLGYSYGTSIGQMYAQLFPTKIRTMVLDGVVNTEQSGLHAADEQAAGFETALKAYFADCAATSNCAAGPDPAASLRRLIDDAERAPIPAPGAGRPATPGVVQLAIGQALYAKQLWPVLSTAIKQGLAGNGTLLVELADQYLGRNPDGSYGNGFDIYFAVSCLDNSWPRDPAAVFANAKQAGKDYPFIGEGLVNDYVRCALWPVKPQPLPELTAKGSPPIVVISTTRDPATPYESGVKVAKRLPHGVLITNEGDGHTIYGQGKACVDQAVDRYFVEDKPPTNGLRCP